MKSEIPSPKSDLALCVRKSRSKSGIPKSEVRDPRAESNMSEIPKSGVRDGRLRSKHGNPIPNPKIRSPAAPNYRDSPEGSPKSEVRRRSQESEKAVRRGASLVMSLMKSDRTKAPKSDRIAG